MAIRRIEGLALWDDISNFVVEAKMLKSRTCDSGWVSKYYLPESDVYATFGVVYSPERRELTKIRGDEEKLTELEEELALFANSSQ